jgi:hypothetical protein
MCTDAFLPYSPAIDLILSDRVDYSQVVKVYSKPEDGGIMRTALKATAAVLLLLSAIATVIAIIALFAGSSSQAESNAALLGGTVISLLLSGALWLLADIAESCAILCGDAERYATKSIANR